MLIAEMQSYRPELEKRKAEMVCACFLSYHLMGAIQEAEKERLKKESMEALGKEFSQEEVNS